jgi:hypothetical protein
VPGFARLAERSGVTDFLETERRTAFGAQLALRLAPPTTVAFGLRLRLRDLRRLTGADAAVTRRFAELDRFLTERERERDRFLTDPDRFLTERDRLRVARGATRDVLRRRLTELERFLTTLLAAAGAVRRAVAKYARHVGETIAARAERGFRRAADLLRLVVLRATERDRERDARGLQRLTEPERLGARLRLRLFAARGRETTALEAFGLRDLDRDRDRVLRLATSLPIL